MSARDDYRALTDFAEHALFQTKRMVAVPSEGRAALDEIDRLRAWKAEAMQVLSEWERTWDAAGRPGRPGQSKAVAVRQLIEGDSA